MKFKTVSGLLTVYHFISLAWSYGTIVEVYPSTCPALPSGPSVPSTQYLFTIIPGPVVITPRSQLSITYLSATGTTTNDCAAAASFGFSNGQVSSSGQLVSTTGLVAYSPFVVSSYTASISTTFSLMNGSTVAWNNTAFVGSSAVFCLLENRVQAVYNAQLPAGCARISIGAVASSTCPTFNPSTTTASGTGLPSPTPSVLGSIRGANATANPFGCLISSTSTPAVSAGLAPIIVATLEQCTDYCSNYAYFGVQSGYCACGNTLASSATPAAYGSCNVACASNSAQNCGSAAAAAVYSIAGRPGLTSTMSSMSTAVGSVASGQGSATSSTGSSPSGQVSSATGAGSGSSGQGSSTSGTGSSSSRPVGSLTTSATSSATSFPTSTGTPNCFDRSLFDGTVNSGYLILCNTALPGGDLVAVNGSNLAECISACTSRSSGPAGSACVAVTFDIAASSNQCKLKSSISIVSAGANDLSQAAIIVTGALAPTIVFSSTSVAMTSTSMATGSTSTMTMSSMTSSTTRGTTVTGSSSTTSTTGVSSNSASVSSATGSASSSSSTISTSSSQAPVPTVTNPTGPLCPTYNGQVVAVGGNFYQVECSRTTIGDTLTGNTSTASSLSECAGFCNLYNLAVPFGCVGVTLLTTSSSNNCLLKSTITSTEFRVGEDSLRLIYPGYPTPTDSITTPTSSAGSVSSSTGSRSSTGSSTGSSTATSTRSSTATGATATSALCPAYNGQLVFFPTYGSGSNYEIECSSTFADIGLAPSIATSLTDCINQCSFLNVNTQSPVCVGVTYTNTAQTSPPSNNCFRKGSVSVIVRGVTTDDSARLIFAGYPSVTDMFTTMGSSTSSSTTSLFSSTTATTTATGSTTTSSSTTRSTATMSATSTASTSSSTSTTTQTSTSSGSTSTSITVGSSSSTSSSSPSTSSTSTSSPSTSSPSTSSTSSTPASTSTSSSTSTTSTTSTTSSSSSSSTASSTSTFTTNVSPTASASIYPAEPVCNGYNGGQLTSRYSSLYDIACNVDLRTSTSDIAPQGIQYAGVFSDCAQICDQYNLNSGAPNCKGFTWVSSITNSATTNCFLKNSSIQNPGSRTNTTNTAGVQSGRLLGPWPSTNQVLLARPIPLITNTLYNGYSIGFDYAALQAPGVQWQIADFADPVLYVGGLGFMSISTTDRNNRDGLTALSLSYNNNTAPYPLPTGIIPPYTVAPYWTLGFSFPDGQQGIYYQIDPTNGGGFLISIEFFYTRWTTNNDVFHWITTYNTANPGIWTSYWFNSGSTNDQGLYQTVGHQGLSGSSTISSLYANGQAGSVLPRDKFIHNTLPSVNSIVRSSNNFDLAIYGQPGRWEAATVPP